MTEVLTPAWCDALTERLGSLAGGPGGSGVVEWVVTGGEPDRVWVRWVVDEGRVASVAVHDTEGEADEAEVTVPLSRGQAEAVLAGEIDPAQAFMRGDLKPEGSSRAWFALLSVLARDDVRSALTGS